MNKVRIEGSVAPGFERVRDLYEENMQRLKERNTQLCVYYQGERVVDLWGSAIGDDEFTGDTLANVFSSGKSLEALAMASLVHQGLLDYGKQVTHYWPEFGVVGKEATTVADLLRHEGGMAALEVPLNPEDLRPENLKQNRVGRIIEEHDQKFRAPDDRREYHAITRGWLLNEVFRRVDPQGRTMGEFLREDVSTPLGADVIIGLNQNELSRRSPVMAPGMGFLLADSLKPRSMGRKMERNLFQLMGLVAQALPALRKGTRPKAPQPFAGWKGISSFNDDAIAMGETPSANAHASARGLAKVAAMLSLKGQLNDRRYLSEDAWQALHDVPTEGKFISFMTHFSQGGVARFGEVAATAPSFEKGLNQGREGFYGWMGLGGSLFQWHPEHQIGFGYVPTSLNVIDLVNERGKAYQAEVKRCVASL